MIPTSREARSSQDASAEEQQLPDDILLASKRLKPLLLTTCFGLMLAGSIWLLLRKPEMMAWLAVGFFGLMTLGALVVLILGNTLELRRDGFRQQAFGRAKSYSWRDVSAFGWHSHVQSGITLNSFVHFETLRDPAHPDKGVRRSQVLCNYKLKPQQLTDLMNAFRERFQAEAS